MNILEDIIFVNKKAFKETMKNLKFVPILAIILFVFKFAEVNIIGLLSGFDRPSSFILGFARAAISIAFISALISILADIVVYNRLDFKNFFNRFSEYFSPLMSTYFIIFIIEMLVQVLTQSITIPYLGLVFTIAMLLLQSPLYEEVYLGNRFGGEAIYAAFDFVKENFLQWLPVLVVYVIAELFFNSSSIMIGLDLEVIIKMIIYGLLLAFIYIYKGHLFRILNGSSMRKRSFQGKF